MSVLFLKQTNKTEDFWEISHELNPKTYAQLINNEIGAIIISNWLPKETCNLLAEAAENFGFVPYENVIPIIGRIGITQFEYKNKKENYFKLAEENFKNQKKIFDAVKFDVLNSVFEFFEKTMGKIEIAKEGEYSYFAGLIRQIRRAYLHFDYAPYDGYSWSNHDIINQFAWNVYLKTPDNGGEAVVFNKMWQPYMLDDHKLINENNGSYGFDYKIVEGCSCVKIKPNAGDLVLFNSRNFHEVLDNKEDNINRISLSSFMGQKYNGQWIAWS